MASAFSESLMAFKILGTTKGMTMNFSSDILVSTGRHKTKRKIWHNSSSLKITDQNQEKTIFSNTTSRHAPSRKFTELSILTSKSNSENFRSIS